MSEFRPATSDQTDLQPLEGQIISAERSSVRIETNAKGKAQTKISVYEGVPEAEMERLMMLAIKTYEDLIANLGKRAQFE